MRHGKRPRAMRLFMMQAGRTLFYRELRPVVRCIAPCCVTPSGSFQRFDTGRQPTLMAGRLILMNQPTGAETVKDWLGNSESGLGTSDIFDAESLNYFFDGSAQHRTLRRVPFITHNGLLTRFLADLILATEMLSSEIH